MIAIINAKIMQTSIYEVLNSSTSLANAGFIIIGANLGKIADTVPANKPIKNLMIFLFMSYNIFTIHFLLLRELVIKIALFDTLNLEWNLILVNNQPWAFFN